MARRWCTLLTWLGLALALAAGAGAATKKAPPPPEPPHQRLADDGLHDPANPGIKLLQDPNDGLANLPPDLIGNKVLWVNALERGLISPRTNLMPSTPIRVLDLDVILPRTAEMPMVRFPHRQHTEWLDCSNCHEHLFASKAGGTVKLNMFQILNGEYCGLCHGAVSFPLTECRRCHSVERTK